MVWVDRDNSYQWRRRDEGAESGAMSAVIGGLPADTPFNVVVRLLKPPSFDQVAPATIAVRTSSQSAGTTLGWADPSDFDITMTGRVLAVEWTKNWPILYTSARLVPESTEGSAGPKGRWVPAPRPSELDPFDEQLERRVRMVFPELRSGTSWRLYVNRRPGHMSTRNQPIPYLCMVWDIRVPQNNTAAQLDPYSFSS